MSSWKAAKEAFVAEHDGSSVLDVLLVSAVPPLCVGLRLELGRLVGRSGGVFETWLDLGVVVVPTAVVLTVGACLPWPRSLPRARVSLRPGALGRRF